MGHRVEILIELDEDGIDVPGFPYRATVPAESIGDFDRVYGTSYESTLDVVSQSQVYVFTPPVAGTFRIGNDVEIPLTAGALVALVRGFGNPFGFLEFKTAASTATARTVHARV